MKQRNPVGREGMENSFSEVLIRLNIPLACCRNFREHVTEVLRLLGECTGHDRIQILEIRPDMTYRVMYEWCRRELKPLPEERKRHAVFYQEQLEQQLCLQNYMILHDTDAVSLPELKKLLEEQECRQLLLLPLFESGSQFAFIVFMQCRAVHEWTEEEIRRLEGVTAVVARQLDNYRISHRLLCRLREEKKVREDLRVLHGRLGGIHEELAAEWKKLRERLAAHGDFREDAGVTGMDGHVARLEEICRRMAVKTR